MFNIVWLFLFFLSGCSALIYEVVWARKLTLIVGVSVFAQAIVIATFMAGLSLGSWYFGKIAGRYPKLFRLYAFLEAGIGLSAVAIFLMLGSLMPVYTSIYRYFYQDFFALNTVRFIFSFLILFLPTFLIGGTMPIMAKIYITDKGAAGQQGGLFYGMNILGGVLGCILSGFFLIEKMGMSGAVYFASGINFSVAITILLLWIFKNRMSPPVPGNNDVNGKKYLVGAQHSKSTLRLVLFIFFLAGFTALAYEILWSRTLNFYLGTTTHAFSLILIVFLSGLGAGSFIFGNLTKRYPNSFLLLAVVEIGIGVAVMLSLLFFIFLPNLMPKLLMGILKFSRLGWPITMFLMFIQGLLIIFIPTFFMGGVFPLVIKICLANSNSIEKTVASAYSLNTLGAIAGSLVAGFILIPDLGIKNSFQFLISLNILIGIILVSASPLIKAWIKKTVLLMGVLILAVNYFFIPPGMFYDVFHKAFGKVIYYYEGVTDTIAVTEDSQGHRNLNFHDGRGTGPGTRLPRYFQGHLPMLLHKNPKDVLVIGFGAGNTLSAIVKHNIDSADCVELSAGIAKAAGYFYTNRNVLSSPKVNLIIDDARNYMLGTNKKYDVINIDSSSFFQSGMVNLYTKEFYILTRAKLKNGGIICVSMPVIPILEDDTKDLIKTFSAIFKHASLWLDRSILFLIGTPEEIKVDPIELDRRIKEHGIAEDMRIGRQEGVERVSEAFLLSGGQVNYYVRDAKIITDDLTRVDFSAPRRMADSKYGTYFRAYFRPFLGEIMRNLGSSDPGFAEIWKSNEKDSNKFKTHILENSRKN